MHLFIVIAVLAAALAAAADTLKCHPFSEDHPYLGKSFRPVINGTLIYAERNVGRAIAPKYNLGIQGNNLTIDTRGKGEIGADETKFRVLSCNVNSTWTGIPDRAPFKLTKHSKPLAGLLEYDGKCLAVKDSAVSMKKCATTKEELATQWVHVIEDVIVFAGDSNRTDARVALEGRRVANMTEADVEESNEVLYLSKQPADAREAPPPEDSRDAGSIATVSISLVALVVGVLFLSA